MLGQCRHGYSLKIIALQDKLGALVESLNNMVNEECGFIPLQRPAVLGSDFFA
jgi:hypothetical protein